MVVPAILEKNKAGVEEKLKLFKDLCNYVQIDIIDNWPEAENTVGLKELKDFSLLSKFDKEIHLMVKNPIKYLDDCDQIGVKTVIAQIEFMDSQQKYLKKCRDLGLKAGLALDLPTFLDKLDKKVLHQLDSCLLMSIKAGAQGRQFDKKVLGKIKRLVRIKKNLGLDFKILLDGGVNDKTAKWCLANGVNQLCVGSYLFKTDNVKTALKTLVDKNNSYSRSK